MRRDFNVIIEEDEDGVLVASVPELRGCHTQARTLDELMVRIREAVELCLEENGDNQKFVPKFVGFQRLSVDL